MNTLEGQGGQRSSIIVVKPERQVQRERITDEELGNLISAVGNHEAKAITLGLMAPESIYTRPDAHRMIMDAQRPIFGWKMRHTSPFNYLEQSLAPIGLVVQEVTMRDDLETVGFVKTDMGKELGDALAGLLLDFSLRYPNISLSDLFGNTPSTAKPQGEGGFKKRAPITRMKILWELVTAASLPIRTTDVSQAIEEKDHAIIGKHMFDLAEKGVVSYDSIKYSKPITLYSIALDCPQENPPRSPYAARTSITAREVIWDAIRQSPDKQWSADELAELYMQDPRRKSSKHSIVHEVQTILSGLRRDGYIKLKRFTQRYRSFVTISNEQRSMLLDLLTILDKFQNQDPETLSFGKQRLKDILSDAKLVSVLLKKAKEHSVMANAIPREESLAQIRTIVNETPGITQEDIRRQLSSIQGRTLNKKSLRFLMASLLETGEITATIEKGVSYFRSNPLEI